MMGSPFECGWVGGIVRECSGLEAEARSQGHGGLGPRSVIRITEASEPNALSEAWQPGAVAPFEEIGGTNPDTILIGNYTAMFCFHFMQRHNPS